MMLLIYINDDQNECTIKMQELFDKLLSQEVLFTIKAVADEEIKIELSYDDVNMDDLSE